MHFWSDGSLTGELDHITIAEGATIDAATIALWIRHSADSKGGILVDIAGDIITDSPISFRGVLINDNGTGNSSDIILNLAETGSIRSAYQGIYVGNAGTGLVQLDLAGAVQGGARWCKVCFSTTTPTCRDYY